MTVSLTVKLMIFILLALFTSWPYFEKFKEYHWWKRIWIGLSILLLVGLGFMDITDSDEQAKADKKEISNQTERISTLSSTVTSLSDQLKRIKAKQDEMSDKEDGRDKKEDARFEKQLNSIHNLLMQEKAGDIAKSRKDTDAKPNP